MAYNFHYTPTGTGVISGKEVLEQTEDAINDLGNTAISGVQEALDKAEQALTNSANAVDDAQTALNTANNAEGVAIQAQTDVSNLSGTVTNIGNRVTTAEGNITNLQGRMTTAESGISGLNTRMGTAEGNITTLQSNVSTAQATANSAQQTANTARQQSYVLRYSSSSVTDNSTIAYSTIDNTDNIKVNDKIIDVDGKIFSIVSVDTANQTVTVGSALIDLALDGNVVHTSGNEITTGFKTFENIRLSNSIKAISLDNATVDLNNCYSLFNESSGNSSGNLQFYSCNLDSGAVNISNIPEAKAFYMISITIRYLSQLLSCRQIFITRDGNKYERNCNGGVWTNWVKDTDKFVTTDTNQTVSGAKTFSEDITIYNSDTSQTTKRLVITSSKVNLGDSNSDSWGISFNAGASYAALINSKKSTSSTQDLQFTVRTKDTNNNLITGDYRLRINANGTAILEPTVSDYISLGSNSNKWKDVNTNLINGLNPGALGLPQNRSARLDISSYITNLGNGDNNVYTAPANGYIWLHFTSVNNALCFSQTSGGLTNYAQTFSRYSGDGLLYVFFPVRKDDTFVVQVYTSSTAVVQNAYFYPCQGNI